MERDLRDLSIFQIEVNEDPVRERNIARKAHRLRIKQKRNGAKLQRKEYFWTYGETMPRNLPPAEHAPRLLSKDRRQLRISKGHTQTNIPTTESPKTRYYRLPIK